MLKEFSGRVYIFYIIISVILSVINIRMSLYILFISLLLFPRYIFHYVQVYSIFINLLCQEQKILFALLYNCANNMKYIFHVNTLTIWAATVYNWLLCGKWGGCSCWLYELRWFSLWRSINLTFVLANHIQKLCACPRNGLNVCVRKTYV